MRSPFNPIRFVFAVTLLLALASPLVAQQDNAAQGPLLGKQDNREEELFKKLEMPDKRPKLVGQYLEQARKRHKELAASYDELGIQIRKKHALELNDDPKQVRKNRREIEKLDKSVYRIKRDMVREARKLRRPLDRQLEQVLAEKAKVDAQIEAAEKAGNEKKARRLAQDFAKRGDVLGNTRTRIDQINYFLFWDDFLNE